MAGPTFLVIGAMKAGTTSLWSYLRAHPEIFMTEWKEPRFFIEKFNWGRGVDWYEGLFSDAGDAKARGEASTDYTMAHAYRGVPQRIASLYPDIKMIYLLRHPIERMRSHYLMVRVAGQEKRTAPQAFRETKGYLYSSAYAFQIGQYLKHFQREQLLLVQSESLLENRLPTLRRIFEFVGVDASFVPPTLDREVNRTDDKKMLSPTWERVRNTRLRDAVGRVTPMPVRRAVHRFWVRPPRPDEASIPPELEQQLLEQLRPDIAALRGYLGPDFDGWGLA